MDRLIVTNSALAYPRVPDDVLRPGDEVLPLIERFDETLFMPGRWYDGLRTLVPSLNFELRELARSLGSLLPAWLGERRPAWGHSAWELFVDHFVKFALGPLLCNLRLARAAEAERPSQVLAWELARDPGWWTGRQMVHEVAQLIAAECGAKLEVTSSVARRLVREVVAPLAPPAHLLSVLRRGPRSRAALPPPAADVLFVIQGPTLVPLYDLIGARLREEHDMRVLGVDLPLGGLGQATSAGTLPLYLIHDLADGAVTRRAIAEAVCGAHAAGSLIRALSECASLAGLPAALRAVLARRVRATLTRDLPLCLLHARLWERALDHVQPSVVVGFVTYNELLAPAILQARHRGTPTVCVQHGICGPLYRASSLLPYDEVLVFGDYARELLEPLAAPETVFATTGHCLYDGLSHERSVAAPRAELLDGRRHLVLVTTQPIEVSLRAYERRWWLELLAEACAALDARMLIKPHPREEELLPSYQALAARWPEHVTLIPHGRFALPALIEASDLLVTRFSTTAMEAAALETPVMTVNLAAGEDQYPFAAEGAAVGVYAEEELLPTLRRLLTDQGARAELGRTRQRFLARHLGLRDGHATERIAARIAARATPRRAQDTQA